MSKTKITETYAGSQLLGQIKRFYKDNVSLKLYVGVPEDDGERNEESTISNAALAYIHENGSELANIPPRPFIKPGMQDAQEKMTKIIENSLKKDGDLEKAYTLAGMVAVSSIKKKLRQGVEPPLSAKTIKARKRKGFKGTKPLVRTGQLLNSITFIVTREKHGED